MYGTGRPVHAQHVEERAEAQHLTEREKGRAACRNSDAVERTQLQLKPTVWANMDRLDDAGEKKLEERTHSG